MENRNWISLRVKRHFEPCSQSHLCLSPALSGQLGARLVSCQTFLFLLAVMNIPYCAAYCLPENNSHKYSEVALREKYSTYSWMRMSLSV